MPKHRSTVYTVVREQQSVPNRWEFSCLIGTYVTDNRAEEVAGAMMQGMRDNGYTDDEFRFTVNPSTWYEE